MQASCNFETEFEVCAGLDLGRPWQISWWVLENTARPLSNINAGLVTITCSSQPSHLWPPAQTRRRRRHPVRATTGELPPGAVAEEGAQAAAIPQAAATATTDVMESEAESEEDVEEEDDEVPDEEDDEEIEQEVAGAFELLLQAELCDDDENPAAWADILESAGQDGVGPAVLAEQEEHCLDAPLPEEAPPPEADLDVAPARMEAAAAAVPAVPKAAPVRGLVGMAEATFYAHGGKLSYYPSKSAFEAVCGNKEHRRCVLTRTSKGRAARGGRVVAGRPCGFLMCWLAAGGACSKEEHKDKARMTFSLAERQAARRRMAESLAGRDVLACERAQAEGEGSEPETLEALI